MSASGRIFIVLVVLLYCYDTAASSDITLKELKNAEYYIGMLERKAKFVDGTFVQQGDEYLKVVISDVAFGDLNGDGRGDAAVIMESDGGGSATFIDLAAVINDSDSPRHIASVSLGDRVKINSMSIRSGVIVIDMTVRGPDDASCCPTLKKVVEYKLSGERLTATDSGKSAKQATSKAIKKGDANKTENPKAESTDEQWVNIYPIGIKASILAIDPQDANVIYATTDKGIFKSVNNGKLWSLFNNLFKGGFIKVDPVSSKTLFWAGTTLFKTQDGGRSWDDISAGVISHVKRLAINPKSPEIMYVATGEGLYKTLNGGKSWGKIAEGEVYDVLMKPESPDQVYASIHKHNTTNLYFSADSGQHFELLEATYSYKEENIKCVDDNNYYGESAFVLFNPLNSNEMLMICNKNYAFGGLQDILKSTNNGSTWELYKSTRRDIGDEKVKDLVFHPKDKNSLYFVTGEDGDNKNHDKILKSVDGGIKWTQLPTPYPFIDISDIKISLNTIYIYSNYGIFKTPDDGQTWEPAGRGLTVNMDKKHLLEDMQTGSVIVADENGFWFSQDKGESWKRSNVGKVKQITTANDQIVYILSDVFRKVMPDKKRTSINLKILPRYFALSPANPQILYAVSVAERNPGLVWDGAGHLVTEFFDTVLSKSDDAGFSWANIDWQRWVQIRGNGIQHAITSLTIDPRSPDTLYMVVIHDASGMNATSPSRKKSILKTTDSGKTWVDITNGLHKSIASSWSTSKWLNPKERANVANQFVSTFASVAVDSSNINIAYLVATNGGIYRSDDAGKTWKEKSPGNYMKSFITNFDRYVAPKCKGRKNCKGTSYDVQKVMEAAGVSFHNVSIDSADPKIIYLATSKGVYRSRDRGDTWELLNKGLFDGGNVKKVIASSSGIYAEGDSGIYRLFKINELQ